MLTSASWPPALLIVFNAAGTLLVLQAMAQASWLGRAGILSPLDTALLLFWPFELWSCSVVASRRLSALGRPHTALATALLPFLAYACDAVIVRWASGPVIG